MADNQKPVAETASNSGSTPAGLSAGRSKADLKAIAKKAKVLHDYEVLGYVIHYGLTKAEATVLVACDGVLASEIST